MLPETGQCSPGRLRPSRPACVASQGHGCWPQNNDSGRWARWAFLEEASVAFPTSLCLQATLSLGTSCPLTPIAAGKGKTSTSTICTSCRNFEVSLAGEEALRGTPCWDPLPHSPLEPGVLPAKSPRLQLPGQPGVGLTLSSQPPLQLQARLMLAGLMGPMQTFSRVSHAGQHIGKTLVTTATEVSLTLAQVCVCAFGPVHMGSGVATWTF